MTGTIVSLLPAGSKISSGGLLARIRDRVECRAGVSLTG